MDIKELHVMRDGVQKKTLLPGVDEALIVQIVGMENGDKIKIGGTNYQMCSSVESWGAGVYAASFRRVKDEED